MTYKEKIKMEHPDKVSPYFPGGVHACPSSYGYAPKSDGLCDSDPYKVNAKTCRECWGREVKG